MSTESNLIAVKGPLVEEHLMALQAGVAGHSSLHARISAVFTALFNRWSLIAADIRGGDALRTMVALQAVIDTPIEARSAGQLEREAIPTLIVALAQSREEPYYVRGKAIEALGGLYRRAPAIATEPAMLSSTFALINSQLGAAGEDAEDAEEGAPSCVAATLSLVACLAGASPQTAAGEQQAAQVDAIICSPAFLEPILHSVDDVGLAALNGASAILRDKGIAHARKAAIYRAMVARDRPAALVEALVERCKSLNGALKRAAYALVEALLSIDDGIAKVWRARRLLALHGPCCASMLTQLVCHQIAPRSSSARRPSSIFSSIATATAP